MMWDYSRAGFTSFSLNQKTDAGTIQGRDEFKEMEYKALIAPKSRVCMIAWSYHIVYRAMVVPKLFNQALE